MSAIKQTIELKQPLGMCLPKHGESFNTEAQTCEACDGGGGRFVSSRSPDFNIEKGEHYKKCDVCLGSGKVAAKVVICWQPSGEVIAHFKDKKSDESD